MKFPIQLLLLLTACAYPALAQKECDPPPSIASATSDIPRQIVIVEHSVLKGTKYKNTGFLQPYAAGYIGSWNTGTIDDGTDAPAQRNPQPANTAQVTFTRTSDGHVVLVRTDQFGAIPVRAVYTGTIAADNKTASGSVSFCYRDLRKFIVGGTWTATLTMSAVPPLQAGTQGSPSGPVSASQRQATPSGAISPTGQSSGIDLNSVFTPIRDQSKGANLFQLFMDAVVDSAGSKEGTTSVPSDSGFKLEIPPKAQVRADKVFALMADQKNVLLVKLKSFPAPPSTDSCNAITPTKMTAEEAWKQAKASHRAQDLKALNCWSYVAGLMGSPDGADYYGSSLNQGRGVAQDLEESRLWYKWGALLGSKEAEKNIAVMSYKGTGGPKDVLKAFYYELMNRQDTVRPGDLATSHYCDVDNPIGMAPPDALAAWMVTFNSGNTRSLWCWEVIGAQTGQSTLLAIAGSQFIDGDPFHQDGPTAVALLTEGANAGEGMAEYYLAKCYHYAFGTAKDEEKAQFWFAKSQKTDEGVDLAKDEREQNARVGRLLIGAVMDGGESPADYKARQEQDRRQFRMAYRAAAVAHGFYR